MNRIDERYFQIYDATAADVAATGISYEYQDENLVTRNYLTDLKNVMSNYVIPPHLDWNTDSTIPKFVMFMFEFKHNLDQQDLVDIWQGLMPKIARTAKKDKDEELNIKILQEEKSKEQYGRILEQKDTEEEIKLDEENEPQVSTIVGIWKEPNTQEATWTYRLIDQLGRLAKIDVNEKELFREGWKIMG